MSLYISVFLLFLPFPSQCVISSKTGFLFVAWSHIFVGKWVCSLVQMTYQLSKYLPFTVPPAWLVTPRILSSSSEQIAGSHCVSYFPKKALQSFHRCRFLQGSLPSQHVQSIPLFIRHRFESRTRSPKTTFLYTAKLI